MAKQQATMATSQNSPVVQGETSGNKMAQSSIPPSDKLPLGGDSGDGEENEGEQTAPPAYGSTQGPQVDNLQKMTETLTPEQLLQRRKPGAKVFDATGKREKRNRIMGNLGLSDLVIPPLTRKATATYRMINNHRIDPATKLPPDPQDVIFPGTYMFHDIGMMDLSQRNKLMKNLNGRTTIERNKISGRDEIVDDAFDLIEFKRGICTVAIDRQYIKYIFLELHPLNATNKFRDKTIPAQFERTDIVSDHSKAFTAAELDLAYEAETIVRKMQKDELIGHAVAAGLPTMDGNGFRSLTDIKFDLRHYARTNPKGFFSLTANNKAAIKLNILDAINWGLLDYVETDKQWVDANSERAFHTVLVGEDPVDSLVDLLVDEPDNLYYNDIMKRINYWDVGQVA